MFDGRTVSLVFPAHNEEAGIGAADCGCTFRLIRRDMWRQIARRITVRGSHFLPEMVILCLHAGHRLVEIPFKYAVFRP